MDKFYLICCFLTYMKFKVIKRFIVIGLLSVAAVSNSSAQKSAAGNEAELYKVVENFRTSLIKKDKSLFLGLFLESNIGWQSVTENESLARIKVKQPKAVKVFVNPKDNYLSFIDFIVKDKKPIEETFANIKISTDGDVAFIGFDYVFLYDGRESNHGKEHWLLVRTENDWKITSVVWSETLPSAKSK